MKKTDKKQSKSRQEALNELTAGLEQSIKDFMDGDKYRAFLSKMLHLHNYSLNNQILIARQRPDATLCASYTCWKSLNRQVKKGESGIQIICPSSIKSQSLKDVRDENGRPVTLPDGSVKQEVVERIIPFFKIGYTFDIKQTEGEPLPELCHNLEGSLSDRQKQIKDILLDICPVPVRFQAISGDANGYYDLIQKEIVIDSSLSLYLMLPVPVCFPVILPFLLRTQRAVSQKASRPPLVLRDGQQIIKVPVHGEQGFFCLLFSFCRKKSSVRRKHGMLLYQRLHTTTFLYHIQELWFQFIQELYIWIGILVDI